MDEDDIDAMVREVADSIRRGPYDVALRGVHDMLTIPMQMEAELTAANALIAELKAALPYDWDKYKASQESLREHMLLLSAANARIAEMERDLLYANQAKAGLYSVIESRGLRIAALEALLGEAIESIEDWAGYASEYFREKHGIAEELAKFRAALGEP